MSLIRSISNPEELYIVGDSLTHYTICMGSEFRKKVPVDDFDVLMKKWDDDDFGDEDNEVVKCNGLKIEFGKFDSDWKIRLSYEDWFIDMWLVTWEYIVKNGIRT